MALLWVIVAAAAIVAQGCYLWLLASGVSEPENLPVITQRRLLMPGLSLAGALVIAFAALQGLVVMEEALAAALAVAGVVAGSSVLVLLVAIRPVGTIEPKPTRGELQASHE